MLTLRVATPQAWVSQVEAHLIPFLQDHAANERKVCHSALTLAVQHPERTALADALIDVAREEMEHFQRLYRMLRKRGATLAQDAPDPYMGTLMRAIKNPDADRYLCDRLVLFSIVEARGHERFALLGEHLADAELGTLYRGLARAEARHHTLYYDLAQQYFPEHDVRARANHLLELEAQTLSALPLRPALH